MFDLYAVLGEQTACPTDGQRPSGLVSGFVDGCTAWSTREKQPQQKLAPRDEARRCYMKRASSASLAIPLSLEPRFDRLPDPSWVGFQVCFTLETPWYSKDDRPFHVLDNPVRKDRVFGVPFMAAASWKGLLRWACRMTAGLHDHLATPDGRLDGWVDPPWLLHLFGNEKGEDTSFQRGALAFYPTWFSKVGFEVINPHSRTTRAGTQPIVYEVVPPGTEGALRLLYAPAPGAAARDGVKPGEALAMLLEAIERLLVTYGISAKRTAGWGTASPTKWMAHRNGAQPLSKFVANDFKQQFQPWLAVIGGSGG
jgi:CRISPR-associated protein Cmr2